MKNKGSFDVANTKKPILVPFFKNPKFCLVKSWNFEKNLVSARRPQNSGSENALYIPLLLPILSGSANKRQKNKFDRPKFQAFFLIPKVFPVLPTLWPSLIIVV